MLKNATKYENILRHSVILSRKRNDAIVYFYIFEQVWKNGKK